MGDMQSPLEGIAFLARSQNRVRVLQTMAEGTQGRQELREELEISRTTFSRVLNEFENRGLIRRTEHGYTTTPAADAILAKFVPLLETMEGIQNLGEAIEWLPAPAYSVDVRHFRDADITTSSVENPAEPFDRGLEVIRAGDTYRGLTSTAIPRYVNELVERHRRGHLDFDGVIQARFLETLRDEPTRAARWHDIAEEERTWIYDGRIPINMHIVDDRVMIWLGERHDDGLDVKGILESENPSVLSWAESLYEEYRRESVPLEPAMLPDT